jgi:hypothetical protein
MIHAREDYNRIQDPADRIPSDEPVFLIRGQDRAAPGAIEAWANLAEAYGAAPDILAAARGHAAMMREYQSACANKVPDL